jgi:hypothetical protein
VTRRQVDNINLSLRHVDSGHRASAIPPARTNPHSYSQRVRHASRAPVRAGWIFLALLALGGCAYPNPNINTYGWQPPPGPSPFARSYLGYDPDYEQSLIEQYVAANRERVQLFCTEQLGIRP